MAAEIHDRGRGPEIKGTRITVYDVMDYYKRGRPANWIADLFRLNVEEVQEAIRYIEAHRHEVWIEYQKMLDREARGNPPWVQEKLDASHARLLAKLDEIRRRKVEGLFRDETPGR